MNENDSGFRYANIGLAVAALIIVAGVVAFRNSSEAAMQVTAIAGFVIGFGVYHYLDERAEARRKRGPQ
jgi:sugar phosphate permease